MLCFDIIANVRLRVHSWGSIAHATQLVITVDVATEFVFFFALTHRATVEIFEPASTWTAQSVTTTTRDSPPYNPFARTEKTQLFYRCVWIGCRKDLFTTPLLSNDKQRRRKQKTPHPAFPLFLPVDSLP
jgi:hypothetical protein